MVLRVWSWSCYGSWSFSWWSGLCWTWSWDLEGRTGSWSCFESGYFCMRDFLSWIFGAIFFLFFYLLLLHVFGEFLGLLIIVLGLLIALILCFEKLVLVWSGNLSMFLAWVRVCGLDLCGFLCMSWDLWTLTWVEFGDFWSWAGSKCKVFQVNVSVFGGIWFRYVLIFIGDNVKVLDSCLGMLFYSLWIGFDLVDESNHSLGDKVMLWDWEN